MISRRPLHFTKDTSMSIRSALAISFCSSVNILGSWAALVNKLLTAMGVSGRGILAAVMPVMRLGSFSCNICSSFSARSSTDFSLRSSRC